MERDVEGMEILYLTLLIFMNSYIKYETRI